jgi:hypothetical protein
MLILVASVAGTQFVKQSFEKRDHLADSRCDEVRHGRLAGSWQSPSCIVFALFVGLLMYYSHATDMYIYSM